MQNQKEKVIIIGSGAAGLTAAIYAARANLKPLVIEGIQPGGQLTITTDVENYPGYADVVQGPWMMEQMKLQAIKVGARIISDIVTKVDFNNDIKNIILDSKKTFECETVIITTGAQAKWLGLESENQFNGKGVSACATCDGFFYRNKEVAVIGGGNTAVEEALYLSRICSKVYLVHRRDALRAEKILQDRVFKEEENGKIEVLWNTQLKEVQFFHSLLL
jgi:thioredoxin reductase (NADPH)